MSLKASIHTNGRATPGSHNSLSLLAHSSRRQFTIAVALMSVIPLLAVWTMAGPAMLASGVSLSYSEAAVASLAILVFVSSGVVILQKYPANIARLRTALERMVKGEFPEAVELVECADDMHAIQEALNILVGRMKARISTVEKEKDALERQLYQSQKLETIGLLAAGITHEINAPVQFVRNNMAFIADSVAQLTKAHPSISPKASTESLNSGTDARLVELANEARQAISESEEGLAQVVQIAAAMKNYLHPDRECRALAVDINRIVDETITLSRNEWKYVADVETQLDPELPQLVCVPGDIRQALMNLVINAAGAIEAGADGREKKGVITLKTSVEDGAVKIQIADTGKGIPADIRHRIFDRFFTTKEAGKGTGMGLSLAYTFVTERHGGNLTFETEVGTGTTFTISLPVTGPKTSRKAPCSAPPERTTTRSLP